MPALRNNTPLPISKNAASAPKSVRVLVPGRVGDLWPPDSAGGVLFSGSELTELANVRSVGDSLKNPSTGKSNLI